MSQKKFFYLLGATFVCCLFIAWFFNQFQDNEKNVIPDFLEKKEESPKEKSEVVKDRFSILQFSDVTDSSTAKMTDAEGNNLIVGRIYLQSKTTGKVFLVSDSLSIYEQLECSLVVDNKESSNIKIKNNDGLYFYIEGLTLLSDDKEVILDTADQYRLVINY